jgi:pentatricopeptide repeat protein
MALIISHFEKANHEPDIILQTILLKAYGKLGDIEKAFKMWYQVKVINNN